MSWSGGVFTRVRNWVTDKANSVNPQAALFDQEDDNFASGLNNCVTKDGLNKPSAAMDWNGQNLTGVLNLSLTGTLTQTGVTSVSLMNGKLTANATFNWVIAAPTSGIAFTVNALAATEAATLQGSTSGTGTTAYLTFRDSAGTRVGYVGCPGLSGGHAAFSSDNGNIRLVTQAAFAPQGTLDGGGTFLDLGWRDMPNNDQAGNYTLVLADRGKCLRYFGAGGHTYTIPANSGTAFNVVTVIMIANLGSGNLTIAITTDTLQIAGTATTGSRTLAPNGLITLTKVGSTNWWVSGAGFT